MNAALLVAAAIVSVLLHEAAHGMVASALGDPVPGRWKRDTWNPLAHIDPLMTLVLPFAFGWLTSWRVVFGAAKPMPIGWNHLGRVEQLTVIMAGVAMNALLGFVVRPFSPVLAQLQLALIVMNLIPLPPLDGWRLVQWTRRRL